MSASRSDLRRRAPALLTYLFPRRIRQHVRRELRELGDDMNRHGDGSRRSHQLGWELLRTGLGVRFDQLVDRMRGGGPENRRSGPGRGRLPLESTLKDLSYAARMLRRNPAFTLVAVLSLTLGIGANTAIFTVVNATLLRNLPVHAPEQLVALHWVRPADEMIDISTSGWMVPNAAGRSESSSFSYPFYERLRAAGTALDGAFAFAGLSRINVRGDGSSEFAGGQVVSGSYYASLGVAAVLGRLIDAGDDDVAAPPVAVLTHAYWKRRFAGRGDIVGTVVHVNGEPFTIVGVSAAGFQGALQVGSSPDVSVPLQFQAQVMRGSERLARGDFWWLHIMGRMGEGSTLEQVRASVEPLYHNATRRDVDAATDDMIPELTVVAGGKGMTEQRGLMVQPLMALAAVFGLVLLIACANVANLLLARSTARRREIAVRLSLGASRGRLIRQLLTESVLLSFGGAALGLVVAVWFQRLLLGFDDIAAMSLNLDLDLEALTFTLVVAVATGLLFGFAPALRASRVDLVPALKQDEGAPSERPVRGRVLATTMMTAQVAMSLVLLIVAGLFVRTLQNLEHSDHGYNPDNVLLFRVDPTLNQYEQPRMGSFYDRATRELGLLPGVRAVSLAAHAPLSNSVTSTRVRFPEREPAAGESFGVFYNLVGPDFFDVFEIGLLSGRVLSVDDVAGAPMVAVVNETFVRRYSPNDNPIGMRFGLGSGDATEYEVVGVVRDVAYQNLRDRDWEVVHLAYSQHLDATRTMTFALRVAGDPLAIAPRARDLLREIDAHLPVFGMRTQRAQRDTTLSQERQFARMSSLLGAIALVLACIGVYGILSYSVQNRTREIGIRVALGARYRDVVRLVARDLSPIAAGVVVGLGAAMVTTRWLESLLFGLTPMDPVSLASATGLLAAVAMFAAWLPARRASRVDPVVALRNE